MNRAARFGGTLLPERHHAQRPARRRRARHRAAHRRLRRALLRDLDHGRDQRRADRPGRGAHAPRARRARTATSRSRSRRGGVRALHLVERGVRRAALQPEHPRDAARGRRGSSHSPIGGGPARPACNSLAAVATGALLGFGVQTILPSFIDATAIGLAAAFMLTRRVDDRRRRATLRRATGRSPAIAALRERAAVVLRCAAASARSGRVGGPTRATSTAGSA